jgi:uncharacterized protein YegL
MKKILLSIIALLATGLLWPSITLAQGSGIRANFQQLVSHWSKPDDKYYLVIHSLSGYLDITDQNLRILIKTKSGSQKEVGYDNFILNNLGQLMNKRYKNTRLFRFNLVIDNSGSIDNQNLRFVENALTKFINNLPVVFEGQIIKFSDTVKKSPFTNDKSELIRFIKEPFNRGNTALFDGIANAVEALKNASGSVPLSFSVIMTDGYDNASHKTQKYQDKNSFKRYILAETTQAKIPLFIVGVTDDVDTPLLREISKFGVYEAAQNFPDLDRAFEVINAVIKDTYIITIPKASSYLGNADRLFLAEKSPATGNFTTIQEFSIK